MSFLLRFICFLFLIVSLTPFLFIPNAFSQETVSLGIAPLVDRSGENSHWGYFLRDILHAALERIDSVALVDSIQVDEIIREARLPKDTVLVQTTAQVLSQRIGCEYLMTGSFRLRDIAGVERFIVSLRLYQAGIDGYVELESEVFDRAEIGRLGEYFVGDILAILGLDLPAGYSAPVFDVDLLEPLYLGLKKRDEALLAYGENQFPDRPLWQEAFSLAQIALDRSPDYLMGYAYLADMYRITGWMAKEVETWNLLLERLGQAERAAWTITAAGRAHLRLAHAYNYQNKPELALKSLEAALRFDPDLAEGYYLMGVIYYDQGNTSRAQELLEEAYRLNPDLKEARYFAEVAERATIYGRDAFEAYRAGYTYYYAGDLTTAVEYFQMAARLNPEMKEAHYWLGRALYDLGKLEESAKIWQRVIEIDPFDSQARRFLDRSIQELRYGREAMNQFRQGMDYYQEGRYQEAMDFFRQATVLSPRFPEAHEFLARCYFRLGDTEQYIRERDKGIALLGDARERGWQYYQVGFELFSWEQPEQAIDFLLKAVREDPDLADAHLLLGELFAEQKRWIEAYEHYSRARRLPLDDQTKGLALWGETVTLVRLERWEEALPLVEEVVKSYPFANFAEEAEALRIETMVKLNKYQDARVAFQQFLVRFPRSAALEKLRFLYGLSFYQDQKYEEAVDALKYFVEQYPGSVFLQEANEALGFSYRALGEEEKAQRFFAQLEGEQGAFLAADTSYRKKDWPRAISGFLAYLESYPQGRYRTEARLKLASSYLESGETRLAEQVMDGWSEEVSRTFPLDYAQFQVKLAFETEQWEKLIEYIERMKSFGEELQTDFLLLEALAYENLGDRDRSAELIAEAGQDPDAVLVDEEALLVQEAADLVAGNDPQTLERLSQILQGNLSTENRSIVLFLYGKTLYLQGDLTAAKESLTQSLAGGVSDFRDEALFYLGDIAYQAGDWNATIEAYEPLLSLEKGEILWRTAQAYRNVGRMEDARNLLIQLVNNSDYAKVARLTLLNDDYQAGRYQNFLSEARRFISDYPDHPESEEILYLSVWAAHHAEEPDQARELITDYMNRFGSEGRHRIELQSLFANLLIKAGESEAALAVLEELAETTEGEQADSVHLRIGTIYLGLERFDRAAFYFERLVNDPNGSHFTQAGYLLGACLEYLDRTEDAIVFYQRVVDSGREDVWVTRSWDRLSLLTAQ
ncbi:MAG TPA: tetratricopeptide repeat protein [Atribacteraceae bacterium]|nr:tetratricopeptide repeat protein [Atribacteraceae bacterium]